MRKRTKAILWIAVAIMIVAVFATTAERRLRKDEIESIESVQRSEGIPVDYVVSRATYIADWKRFVGMAEGLEQINLTADYRTRVRSVHSRVGDRVRAGEVIVSLDQYDPMVSAVNLETAGALYRTARRDSARMEELYSSGAISEQQLDYARAEADRARASYNTARRAVELDSPIAGVVTAVYVVGGQYADAGQVLATVSSYRRVKVSLDVSESERDLIRAGQEVRLPLRPSAVADGVEPRDPRALKGVVAEASLSADPETRLYRIDLILDNPDLRLQPGSLVKPSIRIASSDSLPVVPSLSLMQAGEEETVYVIVGAEGDERAELRTVRTGITSGSLVAVEYGLRPGEWVVVWGQGKLKDGSKVLVHDDLTSEYYGPDESAGGSR
jgi:RND family efflux transporter MFP subunit